MSSFHRTITPSLPTQQIYAVRERKQKNMFEFFIFKHLDSDILELVVTNCDTDTEFEHMILSKKAVLVQVDEELVARFELARMHVADRKRPYATEEGLLEECTNETIGKFIVNHVNVDPKNPKKLLLLPISSKCNTVYALIPHSDLSSCPDRTDAPMSITAIKPRGHSELFYVRDR